MCDFQISRYKGFKVGIFRIIPIVGNVVSRACLCVFRESTL